MPRRTLQTAGRRIPWVGLLGLGLLADSVWSLSQGNVAAGLVVGFIGAERLIHAVALHLRAKVWPWRIEGATLDEHGLEVEERNAYTHEARTTVLPGPLILEADIDRGIERRIPASFVVVVYTILGTILWSEHDDEQEARSTLFKLRTSLPANDPSSLQPPVATGKIEVVPQSRAVMWGAPPVVPVAILLRSAMLIGAIAAVPHLVPPRLQVATWGLVGLTLLLIAFPLLGAITVLSRPAREIATGLSTTFDELRAWENSTPTDTVAVHRVKHIGWHDLRLDGSPLAMRLVAHAPDAIIETIVPRSLFARWMRETYRLAADAYDVRAPAIDPEAWSIRLPGGFAEAIETVSWAQRFLAEARNSTPRD